MIGLVMIFIFVILMAVPGFYIITRKIFPKMSKRKCAWITAALTVGTVTILALSTLVNTAHL